MRPALLSSTLSRSVARLPQTNQCVSARNIITSSSSRFTFKTSAIKNNPILAQMLISKTQVRYFSSPVLLQMPALSPTMESGKILAWKKKEGDQIQPGDVICEIETDKSAMAFEATDEGYLAKILIPDDTEGVKIGQTIAVVVEDKADIGKYKDYTPDSEGAKSETKSEEKSEKTEEKKSEEKVVETPAEKKTETTADTSKSSDRLMASPAARARAAENNIDLNTLKGTGPGNRVIKADVLEAISRKSTQQAAPAKAEPAKTTAPSKPAPVVGASYTDIPNSTIRKVTAARLTQSKQQVPHYYLTQQCKVDSLLKLREQFNQKAKNGEYKLSINDFVIKASALALKKIPTVNSTWNDTFIRQFHTVDINVAINTEHGLFTPLIPNTDAKGLSEISKSVKDLAEKAKINKLTPTESTIGGFTISNLGMFGITHFEAVINPPQAAILAVGGVDQKVSVSNAADGSQTFSVDNVMNVTLSCDHRVVDGAIGAQWLQAFKQYIEDPISMLL